MSSPKPRLLIFPFDLLAHYLRTLQLADQLKDLYDIHFCASQSYGTFVRGSGFREFPAKTFDAGQVLTDVRKFRFSWLNQADVQAVVESQVQAIRTLRPAAVIGDAMPGLRIASAVTETPYIALLNGYMTRFYQHARNLPPGHPLQKVVGKLPAKWERYFNTSGEHLVFRMLQGRFNRIRKKYQLPPLTSYLQELEGDASLICDAPELFPQDPLPPHFHWLGPLFHQQPGSEVAVLTRLDPRKKTLLVSVGSSGNLKRFRVLNDARFRQFNIILAGFRSDLQWKPHVHVVPFANLAVLLKHTDLALLHGGNGSLYLALAARVPVLAAPAIFEQEWNVDALERLGLGTRMPNKIDADSALRLIQVWLDKSPDLKFPPISLTQTLTRFKQIWQTEIQPRIAFSKRP